MELFNTSWICKNGAQTLEWWAAAALHVVFSFRAETDVTYIELTMPNQKCLLIPPRHSSCCRASSSSQQWVVIQKLCLDQPTYMFVCEARSNFHMHVHPFEMASLWWCHVWRRMRGVETPRFDSSSFIFLEIKPSLSAPLIILFGKHFMWL